MDSRFLQAKDTDAGDMFNLLLLCCIIGFVHGQTGLNSTTSDVEVNGTTAVNSELVTNPDTASSDAELATASIESAAVSECTPTSKEDSILDKRHCPRNNSKTCIVKCCPIGESINIHSKVCEPSALKFHVDFFDQHETFNFTADEEECHYIFGDPCSYGK